MTAVKASANGRVNLIGEHTDYNGGFVLPTAIPQMTTVVLNKTSGKTVRATTENHIGDEPATYTYELGAEKPMHKWVDYIAGTTALLAKAGYKLTGFDARISSTVPTGSGLSSSAAIEIAVMKALREAFSLDLSFEQMAKLGQRVENEFVGAKVGIMDQMACALAQFGEALYLDTRSMQYERVPLPLDQMDLIVINSGVKHKLSGDGGYNQRRAECEAACATLGISELRDLGVSDLARLDVLPDVQKRRARHVITENERVGHAVRALKNSDLETLGKLFYESHSSMRDDYQVSVEEIDLLVELCRKQTGVFGARLTGGGFGGSIVAISKKGTGVAVARAVVEAYNKKGLAQATILVS